MYLWVRREKDHAGVQGAIHRAEENRTDNTDREANGYSAKSIIVKFQNAGQLKALLDYIVACVNNMTLQVFRRKYL